MLARYLKNILFLELHFVYQMTKSFHFQKTSQDLLDAKHKSDLIRLHEY